MLCDICGILLFLNGSLVLLQTREKVRDLFSDISMLSERHIAHRTDSQHRKKKKTQQFGHQYKHECTKLTAADYNFLSNYVLSWSLKEFSDCICFSSLGNSFQS